MIIESRLEPRVALIQLDRPEKRNALSIELMNALSDAVEKANKDPSLRVIVFQGQGPVFCAGLDLREAADDAKIEESAEAYARMLKTVYLSPLVTIAAVHGAALAGGAGLMTACDFVIAAEGTQIGYPEVRRGLVAAQVLTLLTRQVAQRELRELLLLGESITPERALSMGLINKIVPTEDLIEAARKIAHVITKGSPAALIETKHFINALDPSSFSQDLYHALRLHHKTRHSEEAKEGIQAFLEKRKPAWEA